MNELLKNYLISKDIHIDTNASDLFKMLKNWDKTKDYKKSFKNLCWKRNDTIRTPDMLLEYIQDNENDIKQLVGKASTVTDLAVKTLVDVVKMKTEFTANEKDSKMLAVYRPEETIYKKKFVDNTIYSYEDIPIFNTGEIVKPNEADKDFYACFVTAGNNIMLKTDKVCRLIFQKSNNNRGELDFKNDLGIRNEHGEDALITTISNEFGARYEKFMKCAQAAMTAITIEDIKNSSDNGIPLIEDIFKNGFVKDGKKYMFPSSFRKFADVKVRYKRISNENNDEHEKWSVPIFDGFVLKPTKGLKSFEFDEFLDYFAANFSTLTKGCLKSFDDWKTFSNSYDVPALSVMTLPSEDVWKNAKMPESWHEFFNGKAPDRILHRVYFYIGSCMDASNKMQQILLIADDGRTGKGEMIRLLQKIFPKGSIKAISNNVVDKPFTVTTYSLYKAHILVNTEYDGKIINTEMMKQISGGDTIECDVKNGSGIQWNTEGTKLIFTSNRTCYLTENAIRGRIIPVSFVPNYKMNSQLDDAQINRLVEDGIDFLNFCYKEYMESPYRTKGGGFIVMNPKQEDDYMESGELPSPDKMKDFLLKAFSKDPDIGDKFKSGDISETHMNDDFEDLYAELFEFDEDEYVTIHDFKELIVNYIINDKENRKNYFDCFDWNYDRISNEYSLKCLNSLKQRQFVAFLEKTLGHEVNKVKKIDGIPIRVVTKMKFKNSIEDKITASKEFKPVKCSQVGMTTDNENCTDDIDELFKDIDIPSDN